MGGGPRVHGLEVRYVDGPKVLHKVGRKHERMVITKRVVFLDHSRYTGSRLREIRAEHGVGRPWRAHEKRD